MIDRVWVTAILFFAAAVLGTISLALVSEATRNWWRRRRVAQRLRPILQGKARGRERLTSTISSVRTRSGVRKGPGEPCPASETWECSWSRAGWIGASGPSSS